MHLQRLGSADTAWFGSWQMIPGFWELQHVPCPARSLSLWRQVEMGALGRLGRLCDFRVRLLTIIMFMFVRNSMNDPS